MCGSGVVLLLVRLDTLPERLIFGFSFLSLFLLLLKNDGCFGGGSGGFRRLMPLVSDRATNRGESREHRYRVIVSDALYGRPSWRYITQKPDADWFKSGFNATGWKEGVAGFGTEQTPGALVHTVWNSDDIWLRREFTLNHEDLSKARLQLHHDEDAEIYLNGVPAASAPGFVTEYYEMDISPEAAATFKTGVNLLAVHCHQTTGGQYIDVGIVAPPLAGTAAPSK